MYSLNRAMVIGNLTRDPELRQTPNGQSVCSFAVATNRQWTGSDGNKQESAEFHNIVAWAKLAEICNQYLSKGRKVYIDGRMQTRDWEGQDGVKRYRTEIVADNMIILDKAPAGNSGGGNPFTPQQSTKPAQEAPPAPESSAHEEEIKLEDIPF